MYDYNPMGGAITRAFETDERGQIHYAPQGSSTKLLVGEEEYLDALDTFGARTTLIRRIFLAVYGVGIALLYILSIERGGFEYSYLWFLGAPLIAYVIAGSLAVHFTLRPFELRRLEASGEGRRSFRFWLGYLLGQAIVFAVSVGVMYVLHRLTS
jgi:hypothetical protein